MPFKYINPGYVKMLHTPSSAQQLKELNQTISKTGYGISPNGRSELRCDLLEISDTTANEFWIKSDVFIPADMECSTDFFITFPKGIPSIHVTTSHESKDDYYGLIEVQFGRTEDGYFSSDYVESAEAVENLTGLKIGALNTMLIHATQDLSSNYTNGSCDININGKTFNLTRNGENYMQWDNSYKTFNLMEQSFSNNSRIFSNIIISDEEIDINEKIVAIPVSTTQSTMELNTSGLYVADKVGQKLLQTPDVYSLADTYGGNSRITGILLVGDPAYTESGSETLIAISCSDTVITEYGATEVIADTDALVFKSWITSSDMTIADLNGMSFGWKASG